MSVFARSISTTVVVILGQLTCLDVSLGQPLTPEYRAKGVAFLNARFGPKELSGVDVVASRIRNLRNLPNLKANDFDRKIAPFFENVRDLSWVGLSSQLMYLRKFRKRAARHLGKIRLRDFLQPELNSSAELFREIGRNITFIESISDEPIFVGTIEPLLKSSLAHKLNSATRFAEIVYENDWIDFGMPFFSELSEEISPLTSRSIASWHNAFTRGDQAAKHRKIIPFSDFMAGLSLELNRVLSPHDPLTTRSPDVPTHFGLLPEKIYVPVKLIGPTDVDFVISLNTNLSVSSMGIAYSGVVPLFHIRSAMEAAAQDVYNAYDTDDPIEDTALTIAKAILLELSMGALPDFFDQCNSP